MKSTFLACVPLALVGTRPAKMPRTGELNAHIVAVLRQYPTDGQHRYYWPKMGGWGGNTCDLRYRGKLFAKGDPKGRAFCCGLTFEVFLKAWERWSHAKKQPFVIPGIETVDELKKLRAQWFGSDGNRKTLLNALVANKLGVRVAKLTDAKAGDFVQFWRHSGSGHSVIFDSWVTGKDKKIVGMRYWSTQRSTKGIGYRVERFGGKRGIKRDEIYIARVGRPAKTPAGKGEKKPARPTRRKS